MKKQIAILLIFLGLFMLLNIDYPNQCYYINNSYNGSVPTNIYFYVSNEDGKNNNTHVYFNGHSQSNLTEMLIYCNDTLMDWTIDEITDFYKVNLTLTQQGNVTILYGGDLPPHSYIITYEYGEHDTFFTNNFNEENILNYDHISTIWYYIP